MVNFLSHELLIAELAAQRAAILTAKISNSLDKGEISKSDHSPVSVADFGAQALIVAAIQRSFPNDKIIGEENADILRKIPELQAKVWEHVNATFLDDEQSEILLGRPCSPEEMCNMIDTGRTTESHSGRVWTVDPIDGTRTFLTGSQYCLAISLLIDGIDQIGITACPRLNVGARVMPRAYSCNGPGCIVSAVRGHGAQVRPISTGALLPAKRIAKVSILKTKDLVFSSDNTYRKQYPQIAEKLGAYWHPIDIHSSQVRYAALALGIVDCHARILVPIDKPQYIWDHSGGVLIFEEVGGKVTDLRGIRPDMSQGRMMSAKFGAVSVNEAIHAHVLSTTQEVLLLEFPSVKEQLTCLV